MHNKQELTEEQLTLRESISVLAAKPNWDLLKNYNNIALDRTNSRRSANVLILEDAITVGALPFTLEELKKVC